MIKVAGIQFSCREDKNHNIQKALTLSRMAVDEGTQVICFQELFNTSWFPYAFDKNKFSLAEEIPGETTEVLSGIAADNKVVIICPIFEKGNNNLYYNTAVVINTDGSILGKYRKVHIPSLPLWEEKAYFEPGDSGMPIFKTDFITFGIQICWDNFFPEGARILALKGAQIIFSPTAAAFQSQDRWEKMICANAIANNIYIFRINRTGNEKKQNFYGKTFCTNPNGEIMSEPSGRNDSIIIETIDFSLIQSVRSEYGYLKDRRSELYFDIVQ